jgi:hypothetical protein
MQPSLHTTFPSRGEWEQPLPWRRQGEERTGGRCGGHGVVALLKRFAETKSRTTHFNFFLLRGADGDSPRSWRSQELVSVERVVAGGNCRFDVVTTGWSPANKLLFVPGRSPCHGGLSPSLDPPPLNAR